MVSLPPPRVAPPTHSSLHPSDRHIQGYCVNIARVGKSISRAPPDPATTASLRGISRTRRPPFDGNCDACGKYGHEAVSCDALGMAIYMRLYCRDKKNKPIMDEAEQNWNQKNKKWVSESTPRKILARYCSVVGVPEEQIDSELDWDMLYSDGATDTGLGEAPDALECHRVAVPAAVDWFNRSSSETSDDPDWIPQSCRVNRSPDAPQGSLLEASSSQVEEPMRLDIDDILEEENRDDIVVGEDSEVLLPSAPVPEAVMDEVSFLALPSFPRSVGHPEVDAAIAQEMASVHRAFGSEPSRPLDVTEWL
jgi:hypothetical protein